MCTNCHGLHVVGLDLSTYILSLHSLHFTSFAAGWCHPLATWCDIRECVTLTFVKTIVESQPHCA